MNTNVFYAEQPSMDGTWVPVKYFHERPSEKTSTGQTRRIRAIKEIELAHLHLNLSALQQIYGEDTSYEDDHRSISA